LADIRPSVCASNKTGRYGRYHINFVRKVYYNKTNQMHKFLKFILGMKVYMFRTVPLSFIRSFSPYTQQWYMLENMYNIYHCCVYGEKLLMMDRGTVRNM